MCAKCKVRVTNGKTRTTTVPSDALRVESQYKAIIVANKLTLC